MFGYGSGVSATICMMRGRDPVQLERMKEKCNLEDILAERILLDQAEVTRRREEKKRRYGKNNWSSTDSLSEIRENTYYLLHIDSQWRRYYSFKSSQSAKL